MITFTSYENFKPKNDTSFDISWSSTDPTDPIDGLTGPFGTTIVDSGLTSPISASNGSGNSNTVSVSVMEGFSDSSSTFKLTANRVLTLLILSLIDFTTHSNRAFIYHSGYDQTYEKQKANLESLGFIVSGETLDG